MWGHNQQESGLLRASAHFYGGAFAGLGIVSGDGDHSEPLMALTAPANGDSRVEVAAIALPVIPVIGVLAHLPPLDIIIFILAKVANGKRREVASRFGGMSDERLAIAHAFGDADVNLVFELVGDELEEVLGRALELTDDADISAVRTLHTTARLTRGFGVPVGP